MKIEINKIPKCCKKCMNGKSIGFINCNGCTILKKWKKSQIKREKEQ